MDTIRDLRRQNHGFYPHLPEGGGNACSLCGLGHSTEHAVAYQRHAERALAPYRLPGREEPATLTLEPTGHPETVQTHVQDGTILTEIGDRTVLTAPMTRNAELDDIHERATVANPHYLNLTGNFVGADKPNRNGAMWSSQDLARAADTVPYGPLNWLHEGRKVIGAITGAWFSASATPITLNGDPLHAAGDTEQPHIKADAVAWRWLYPQECSFIEASVDAGHAYYSMECIGKAIACADHGCGEYEYAKAMRGDPGVCEHVRTRSGARRIVDPVFLGGAAIVPPARPGWPDAHLSLMRTAQPLAEAASALRGDLDDGQWEMLMALVVQYATGV